MSEDLCDLLNFYISGGVVEKSTRSYVVRFSTKPNENACWYLLVHVDINRYQC